MSKPNLSHDEYPLPSEKEDFQLNVLSELTENEKVIIKKARRKIDIRVVPIVILIYIAALMDRSNIGAALVNGLREGLKLTKSEQASVTSTFYIFYIICESKTAYILTCHFLKVYIPPSNILLKMFTPHAWFGFIGCAWSIICISLAFTKTGTTFIICRCILGALESGLTPGVVGYLQYWYTRSEVAFRMTLFFSAIPIAGIIGSPLAGALANIKVGKFLPFQSIFLFEGLITFIICAAAFFIIQDYPDKATFFTPDEHELVTKRLRIDQGVASESKVTMKETIKYMLDWKVWVYAVIYFGINNAYTIISLFAPTLIRGLGYSGNVSTYLSIIPSIGGLISCAIVLALLNKVKYVYLIFIFCTISIIFFALVAFTSGKVIRLFYIGVVGFGTVPSIPILVSWMSVNQGGIYKGIISSAIVVSFASICGAVSPYFFVDELGPKYIGGNVFAIGFLAFSMLLSFFMFIYFKRVNKYRDENPVDLSHLTEAEQRLMNNDHPNFRFRL
ncbi:putative transporter [Smittium culicis]|uniref:Putative transporter n=1 Tax=Smittium culicis TaxID=133412 RepID=A0A1R1YD29_9FUNG|nr:putative transporter [Smittium culicis]